MNQTSSQAHWKSLIRPLFEDDDLLVVSKPVGLVVDSGRGADDLVSTVGGGVFPFHRLDRETSGIVMLGKTRRYAREITALFEQKRIRKAYMAVVSGEWTLSKVETPIEGRSATTTFRRFGAGSFASGGGPISASWIEALPKTGRTHQIRIHCAESGHAVLGDERYASGGGSTAADDVLPGGHALHAYRLDFRHPGTGETVIVRDAPLAWRTTWLAHFEVEPAWSKMFADASSVG